MAERCYVNFSGEKIGTTIAGGPFRDELYHPSQAYLALLTAIRQLTSTDLIQLQALMWLGRGGSEETVADWGDLLTYSEQTLQARTPDYIAEKVPLAKYLRSGLAQITLRQNLESGAPT